MVEGINSLEVVVKTKDLRDQKEKNMVLNNNPVTFMYISNSSHGSNPMKAYRAIPMNVVLHEHKCLQGQGPESTRL